jgi:hypothetical protein
MLLIHLPIRPITIRIKLPINNFVQLFLPMLKNLMPSSAPQDPLLKSKPEIKIT